MRGDEDMALRYRSLEGLRQGIGAHSLPHGKHIINFRKEVKLELNHEG